MSWTCARLNAGTVFCLLVTRQSAERAKAVKTVLEGSSVLRPRLDMPRSLIPRETSLTPASVPPPTIVKRGGAFTLRREKKNRGGAGGRGGVEAPVVVWGGFAG